MRVLGVDPGSQLTGWGVVEGTAEQPRHVASGVLDLRGVAGLGARLATIHEGLVELLDRWRPEAVALECAFVDRNALSALRLGEARGVVLAAAAAAGRDLHEYTPAQVKRTVAGHGRADKRGVGRAVASRLGLRRAPQADAGDALAVALCHLHTAPFARRVAAALAAERRRGGRRGRRR